ncbi:MAG TPA: fumarylacetoacetate hydrolase family protein [bacterium]|nr:fumarylacetoacetate hydrolase family protein [bacterium]
MKDQTVKMVRFVMGDEERCGIVSGKRVRILKGDFFGEKFEFTGKGVALEKVRILPPVSPSKIVAVGLNYRDHIEEFKSDVPAEPCIFLKPPSAVIGHGDAIVMPAASKRVDYEAELAIVIRRCCRNIAPEQAKEFVLGYTCLNDVTARDLQNSDKQWARAKSFDTFCPVGPFVVSGIDPDACSIRSIQNGAVRQDSHTSRMVFSCSFIVSFVSRVMTLMPGDLIATGTPGGGGTLTAGDTIEVDIEGIGTLTNTVAKE